MLVKFLKHFKAFIIMLMILGLLVGIYSFKTFPKEASPAVNVPFFTISLIYPGADPETIEKQVVEKLENNLASVAKLKQVNSVSAYNVWVISVEFARDKNISEAYSDINSAIDKTKANFPDAVREAVVKRVDVTEKPIYTFSVTWPYLPNVLYDKIRTLEDKLQIVPWVSEVDVIGAYTPVVKIKFDYEKLLKNKINFSYAITQVQTYLDKFPADKKDIDKNLYTMTLRSYPSEFENIVPFLENLSLIDKAWNSISLKEVAKITTWPEMYKKQSYVMDWKETFSSVTYSIKKIPGTDILEAIDNVKEEINIYLKDSKNIKVFEIDSQKEKIDSTYKTFISNFWQTSIIIFIIILTFIGFKESIWITLVFPLVYFISFIALKNIGYTFNNIVSFSLVLTLWIMVDNLIVVIEWFEEWSKKWLAKWDAIAFSIKTYWKPIVSWNFTTISMFMPIGFMLSGKIWDFMKYMPTTIDVVLIVSIFVSLIFLPVVLSFLKFDSSKNSPLPQGRGAGGEGFFKKLERFFKLTIKHYKIAIWSFIILFVITIWAATQFLKADFLPLTDTNNIYVNLKFDRTTTLDENKKITANISKKIWEYFDKNTWLLDYQGISIWNYKSLNPLDSVVYSNSFNPDLSYITLRLTDKDTARNYESFKMIADLKDNINKTDFSKKLTSLEFFIIKSGPSGWKDIWFYLVWEDLEDLVNYYNKIETELKAIPWTYDWSHSLEYTNWKAEITWDIQKLEQFNISSKELDILIASIENSTNYEPNWVLLKKLDDYSSDLIDVKAYTKIWENNILDIQVPWRDIYLKQLIKKVDIKWEVKSLIHSDAKLILSIWAYKTTKTSLWDVTPVIESTIEKYKSEIPGVELSYAWDVKDMQNSMKDLLKAFWIWIMLMFSVLVLHFWNFKQPFLVLSVIPFLFIWAMLLLMIAWLPFSFPAQLWMFWLMWVWVNDAILLIEKYNSWNPHLTSPKGRGIEQIDSQILEVIKARFKPVLLTTITTVLGLATLAIKDDLWWSLAVAFIGWLLLWTFIILVYIPAMLKWGLVRNEEKK